jgi:hypothetical protein
MRKNNGELSGLFINNYSEAVDVICYESQDVYGKKAALVLKEYLDKILGISFKLKDAIGEQAKAQGIYVGNRVLPEELLTDVKQYQPDEEWLCLESVKGKIYLYGNDAKNFNGTLRAVFTFLEEQLGVRWLWPGKIGTVIPRYATIRIPELHVTSSPSMKIRDAIFGYPDYFSKNEENELKDWVAHQKFGRSILPYEGSGFQHNFHKYITPEEHGESNPEYFSLVNPRNWIGAAKPTKPTRTNQNHSQYWQLCTSNSNVRKIIAEKIIGNDTEGLQSISPLDGYYYCECEKCKSLDKYKWEDAFTIPDLSNRIFDFVKDVAEQVYAQSPKSKVGIYSYVPFVYTPDNIDKFPDNVYVALTYACCEFYNKTEKGFFEERVSGFNRLGAKIVGREYWGCHYYLNLPWLHTKLIEENLKFLAQNGCVGLYGEAGKDWSNNALNYYVLAKMMWNVNLKREDIITDFCRSAFGKAAEEMRNYFEFVENHIAKWFENKYSKGKHKIAYAGSFPYAERICDFIDMFDRNFFAEAKKLLAEARTMVDTDEHRERIEFFETGCTYSELLIDMFKSYRRAAAIGVNLPQIVPDNEMIILEDKVMDSILQDAVNLGNAREKLLTRCQGEHSLDLGLLLIANKTELRPWHRINQDALWQIRKGDFNYLVNGDFEWRDYSWKFVADEHSKWELDLNRCHDDVNNIWAQYHQGQGISLKVELNGECEFNAKSLRKFKALHDDCWYLSGWINCNGNFEDVIEAQIIWDITGKQSEVTVLTPVNANCALENVNGWKKMEFAPVSSSFGKADANGQLILILKGCENSRQTVWLDNLKLKKETSSF